MSEPKKRSRAFMSIQEQERLEAKYKAQKQELKRLIKDGALELYPEFDPSLNVNLEMRGKDYWLVAKNKEVKLQEGELGHILGWRS